jgi:6-pyruvoyltetrahydropterin/6-carboxytetrahydropterin synthase
MRYISTKTYGHEVGLSCAFRQWKASSHCRYLHGYALAVKFVFCAEKLDYRNWVVDFGRLGDVKTWLQEMFDHKTLIAHDDPALEDFRELHRQGLIRLNEVPAVGCEAFAEQIFNYVHDWLLPRHGQRVQLLSVEVREHGANSAICERGK